MFHYFIRVISVVVFLDLSEAFDSVEYNILLVKAEKGDSGENQENSWHRIYPTYIKRRQFGTHAADLTNRDLIVY